MNPEEIIKKVEFGTSRLSGRIEAINKLADAGYKVGILIAPVIYVHTKINEEAFPTAINLYNRQIMTGRGKGKYSYNKDIRAEATVYLEDLMHKYFPSNKIEYIV